MKKRTVNVYKVIMLMIVCIMITFILTTVFIYNVLKGNIVTNEVITSSQKDTSLIQTINYFQKIIDSEYIGEEVDKETLINGAIKGYIEALGDPYSEYYTAEEMEEIMAETTGNYVGIGTYIGADLINNVMYLWPMEDSPAARAGVQDDDILLKVNGVEYQASEMDTAVAAMKDGEVGEEVTLQIKRGEEIKDIVVKKENVVLKHVTAEMLDEEIGLITIDSFDGDTSAELKAKYEELKGKGLKKLIIDIRDNGGGIVDEAVEIADFFLEKDKTILIETNKNGKEEILKSENDPMIKEPVVILMNGASASASEIFAAALKENDRATLVGTNTYGKGQIQTLRAFSNGTGMKLTTEEFLTPNRNKIHEIGIKPDIEENLNEEAALKITLEHEEDNQLQKAIEEVKKK